ncbi:ubiquitin C-terminal hydrolase L3 [Planoprotostelium fungivorum]|uniref:Ubiquitin carboxyl-terminal hydrolase n=1 Tax=Planoprotostelium fungivorum TaxID=1890364 RepID=A0A2P6NX41_9EUKA|nr:ubiquitin C-terminal hydrolase L3 [Planoprotostelium fungivorum]
MDKLPSLAASRQHICIQMVQAGTVDFSMADVNWAFDHCNVSSIEMGKGVTPKKLVIPTTLLITLLLTWWSYSAALSRAYLDMERLTDDLRQAKAQLRTGVVSIIRQPGETTYGAVSIPVIPTDLAGKTIKLPSKVSRLWLDVGAHRESMMCRPALLEQDDLAVIAFEPLYDNWGHLNIKNHHERLFSFPAAVSPIEGYQAFRRAGTDMCSSLKGVNPEAIRKDWPGGCTETSLTYEVPTVRLETIIEMVPSDIAIEFLKVDAQGSDLDVIKSAGKLLSRISTIVVEVQLLRPLYAESATEQDFIDYFKIHGFKHTQTKIQNLEKTEANMLFVNSKMVEPKKGSLPLTEFPSVNRADPTPFILNLLYNFVNTTQVYNTDEGVKTFIPLGRIHFVTTNRLIVTPENNPEVLSQLAESLGIRDLLFQDVYSLDAELLSSIQRPVYALIFISPGVVYRRRRNAEFPAPAELPLYDQHGDDPIMWFRQTIQHSCGLMSLIHSVSNGPARRHVLPDSLLGRLLHQATPLKPAERARVLYDSEELARAHQSAARCGGWKGPIDRGQLSEDEDVLSEKALRLGLRHFLDRANEDNGFSLRLVSTYCTVRRAMQEPGWLQRGKRRGTLYCICSVLQESSSSHEGGTLPDDRVDPLQKRILNDQTRDGGSWRIHVPLPERERKPHNYCTYSFNRGLFSLMSRSITCEPSNVHHLDGKHLPPTVHDFPLYLRAVINESGTDATSLIPYGVLSTKWCLSRSRSELRDMRVNWIIGQLWISKEQICADWEDGTRSKGLAQCNQPSLLQIMILRHQGSHALHVRKAIPCFRCKAKGIECIESITKQRKGPKSKRIEETTSSALHSNDSADQFAYNLPSPAISTDMERLWNMLVPDIEEQVPPSMFVRTDQQYEDLLNTMSRFGHNIPTETMERLKRIQSKQGDLQKFITPEQKEDILVDFEKQLQSYTTMASLSDVPTIIIDRAPCVRYLNFAATNLFSWTLPLPQPDPSSIFHILSPEATQQLLVSTTQNLEWQERIYFRSGYRNMQEKEPHYESANYVCTIKKDLLGLLQLIIIQMLPDQVPQDQQPPSVLSDVIFHQKPEPRFVE